MPLGLTAARRIFLGAGVYGVLVLLPQYFMEGAIGRLFPPAITHPEHFYGFVGTALAWQLAFFVIARDVVRFRLFMIPAMIEKGLFPAAVLVLFAQGRVPALTLGFAVLDLVLAALFLWAFVSVPKAGSES